MTKRRKRKKESSGALTTLFEILFGGIAGAAVAAVWLVFKPVDIVDRPRQDPDEVPVRHAVHYQPGKLGLVRESQVRQKEQAVLQQSGAEISLSEQEINRWLVTRYGATPAQDVMGTGIEMRPEPPMIRMVGDELQIGVVYSFAGYDGKKNMILQTTGHFDRAGSGQFEFVPTKTYLGSCPLPSGIISRFALNTFMSGFAISDELSRAWSGLRHVALADGHLKLQFGGAVAAPVLEPVAVSPAASEIQAGAPAGSVAGRLDSAASNDGVPAASPDLTALAEEAVVALPVAEQPSADTVSATVESEVSTGEDVPSTVPSEGDAVATPVASQAELANAPAGEETISATSAPQSDGFETMTIEAGADEETPADVPVESN